MRSKIVGVLTICTVLFASSATSAYADSTGADVTNMGASCAGYDATTAVGTLNPGPATMPALNPGGCTIAAYLLALKDAGWTADEALNQVQNAAGRAAMARAGAVAQPIVGEFANVFLSTVTLRTSVSLDALSGGLTLTPVVISPGVQAAGPSGFEYDNQAKIVWDPSKKQTSDNGHVDGSDIFNLYHTSYQSSHTWDFWAITQDAEASAVNGGKGIGAMYTSVQPKQNAAVVDNAPTQVIDYGSSYTNGLNANLGGEFSGGASVGYSESWTHPLGKAGGGRDHKDLVYSVWWDSSSPYYQTGPQSALDVSTWRSPINAGPVWTCQAEADDVH